MILEERISLILAKKDLRLVTDFSGTIVFGGGPHLGKPVNHVISLLKEMADVYGPFGLLERFKEASERLNRDLVEIIYELNLQDVLPPELWIDDGRLYPGNHRGYRKMVTKLDVHPSKVVVFTDFWLHAAGAIYNGIGSVILTRPLTTEGKKKIQEAFDCYRQEILRGVSEESYLFDIDQRFFVVSGLNRVKIKKGD
ncbi:MAG: hypothetical protein IT292_08190 [Deltaproteobacteria bacterium]|nr:hypothetical protein [Deltaproteobacteria bacterium]